MEDMRHRLPWNVNRLGCRAEYWFRPQAARNGAEAAAAVDPPLDRFMHLWALNRGILHYEAGRLDAALADFRHALEAGAPSVDCHYQMALVYRARRDWAGARAVDGPGNKGHEAALAAVEMAGVVAQLTRQPARER